MLICLKSIKYTSCLIFFLASLSLFAQNQIHNNDSLNLFFVHEEALNLKNFEKNFTLVDTNISGFQHQEFFYHDHVFYAKSAASGAAQNDLIFNFSYNSDQISSHKYFSHFFFNQQNAKYYFAKAPVAKAFYMMGPKREQNFNFLFSRNFGELFNISTEYYLLYSPGIYQYQKWNNNFVTVSSNFHSKNKKYVALANYFYNRMKIQENGGIKYDSVFTSNDEPNRERIEVNLTEAENRVKESGIYFKQLYFPGFTKNINDTIKGNEIYDSFGRLSYSLLFRNLKEVYLDNNPSSGFYQNIFFPDSSRTHDSLQVNIIENKFEWSNARFNINDSLDQHFFFTVGVKHQKHHLYGMDTTIDFHSFNPESSVRIFFYPFSVHMTLFYVTGGHNKNDFSMNASADFYLKKRQNYFSFGAENFSQTPGWYDLHYVSNHFFWNYDFDKINSKKIFLSYTDKKTLAQISFFNIENPVYYNVSARPNQFQGHCQILQARMKRTYPWKKWGFDEDIVFQKVLGTNVIRLPELMINPSVYYSDNLIKNVLSAQFGFELTFISRYFPLAYMPATRQFYLQNDYQSSAYPYLDFFMNFKIKRIRILLKLDHLNSGLSGYDYFMIPDYPMSDRSFRFGLSWIFYN